MTPWLLVIHVTGLVLVDRRVVDSPLATPYAERTVWQEGVVVIKVSIRKGEDGYFVARCPSLKSCWSQGKTREEALANIREAIALYLEADPKDLMTQDSEEVVEIPL